MTLTLHLPRSRLGLALASLLALPAEARPDVDTVRVDLVSDSVGRRLPFDVPFELEGEAPPGTSRVEMRLQWEDAGRGRRLRRQR
jgi:hypothetical protein